MTTAMPMRHKGELVPVEELGDQALRYLGLDPRNPVTVVLALLARKYDLDPLLNEVAVIRTGQGLKPYITRDGLLVVAHRSGELDGIVVDDVHEGEHGWGATVSVWRKDMSHPFTYSAGCGKNEPQAKQGNGPEMAIARAERRALHRAFAISGDLTDDTTSETGDVAGSSGEVTGPAVQDAATPVTGPVTEPEQTEANDVPANRYGELDEPERQALALVASRNRTQATSWADLNAGERARVLGFLSDVDEGIATIDQLDDGRYQIEGPGAGGRRWVYWINLTRLGHTDAVQSSPVDELPVEP